MDIVITAIHCELSDTVKDYAREKVSRLDRFFDKARKVKVAIHASPGKNEVELNCIPSKGQAFTVAVTAEGSVREAIDLACDKMARQLRRHKDRLRGFKGKSKRKKVVRDLQQQMQALSARLEALDDEITYEDAVKEE